MHLMFPPPPKRRDLCQMGSRLMAKTHQLSPQDPGRCKAVALGNNSIATETFLGCLWKICIIIEICAGSARFSKVAHECGFRTMANDHSAARTCGFPICVFDLADANDLESLVRFIEESADSILGNLDCAFMWNMQSSKGKTFVFFGKSRCKDTDPFEIHLTARPT